jgi:hypothetical protein
MKIDYGNIAKFAQKHGSVSVPEPTTGKIKVLEDGDKDSVDLIEKATHFVFNGKRYTRVEFAKLMDKLN